MEALLEHSKKKYQPEVYETLGVLGREREEKVYFWLEEDTPHQFLGIVLDRVLGRIGKYGPMMEKLAIQRERKVAKDVAVERLPLGPGPKRLEIIQE